MDADAFSLPNKKQTHLNAHLHIVSFEKIQCLLGYFFGITFNVNSCIKIFYTRILNFNLIVFEFNIKFDVFLPFFAFLIDNMNNPQFLFL